MTTQVETLVRRRRPSAVARLAGRVSHFSRWVTVATGVALIAATGLVTWALVQFPVGVPWTVFAPIAVLAGIFLTPRWIAVVYGAIVLGFAWSGWEVATSKSSYAGSGLVLVIVGVSMLWLAQSRARLGVQGTLGESMLVDLRDRLRAHGELPDLPHPWHAETALQSAYGHAFSGDFIVANRSQDGSRLEVTLVDVSGKGLNAGTKALLLSGALGGLLGAMAPEDFLPAANSYLLRQDWSEGFATAIHVALDLETGDFSVGGAGHPPAATFSAGSGRWRLLDDGGGPLLGVLESTSFPRSCGRLERGDALLLYTDGVIETRTRDLTVGIDRMLGTAEQLVSHGFTGGADRICATARAGETDDRAVVLIWRG
ncbi:PP2C family protein-serine/threonine phosphatase [Oryzihumus sp.]|uniref:PP2C family protein-serine/threonine phosphatase n=1 Tax=Oryzihumus sp. TaxID=1968903 RepID=UPI002EDAB044